MADEADEYVYSQARRGLNSRSPVEERERALCKLGVRIIWGGQDHYGEFMVLRMIAKSLYRD